MDYPITQAIRILREKKIEFEPYVYEYIEKGGTKHSAEVLRVDEYAVVKTLIFETNEKKTFDRFAARRFSGFDEKPGAVYKRQVGRAGRAGEGE